MEGGQPGLDWKQSEVSPPGDIGGQRPAEHDFVVGEGGVETAGVGHGPLHGAQQKQVDENTVANGVHLAEETRP